MTRERVAEIVTWCLENPAVPRNGRTFGRQVAAMLSAEGLLADPEAPCELDPDCEFPRHDPSAHPCGKRATEASTPFVLGGEGTS